LSASIFLGNMLAFKAGLAGVTWVYLNEQPFQKSYSNLANIDY